MTKKNFPTISEIDSLYKKHVLYKKDKDRDALFHQAMEWLKVSSCNKIPYEVNWFGLPIIQFPEDMIVMQELIFRTRPDVIIETGVAHGGSVLFYASICELLGHGQVVGIDIDIRAHNKRLIGKHPFSKRLTLIEASSVASESIQQCRDIIGNKINVLVILDSDHSKKYVLQELYLYSQFISKGNYLVVFDTTAYYVAEAGYHRKEWKRYNWLTEGAKNAVDEFLTTHPEFSVDDYYEKLYITAARGGFLHKK